MKRGWLAVLPLPPVYRDPWLFLSGAGDLLSNGFYANIQYRQGAGREGKDGPETSGSKDEVDCIYI